MIRFLEANGYDVSYTTGLDVGTATGGSLLTNHKIVPLRRVTTSTGPARSGPTSRRPVTTGSTWRSSAATRCSGRRGSSRASTRTQYREPDAGLLQGDALRRRRRPAGPARPGPATWQDPRFSPPADGGRPQNPLTGQLFMVNSGTTDIRVPAQYGKLRFWRNTAAASLGSGQTLTLGPGQRDTRLRVGLRAGQRVPPGRPDGPVVDDLHLRRDLHRLRQHHPGREHRQPTSCRCTGHPAGRWSSARAPSSGPGGSTTRGPPLTRNMRQATVNLFADMGVQPYALAYAGLTRATQVDRHDGADLDASPRRRTAPPSVTAPR